jgi:uncharacterized protein
MTAASPVGSQERHESIDLLRGVALLGILVMNIQSFAMPMAAYFNPTALGDRGPIDFAVWTAGHLFFDQKFMTIFSWLFGAGIVLMTRRREDALAGQASPRARPAAYHYRRMLALLIFGLIHAYLIWDGDILVVYAICGSLVFPLRNLRPAVQMALGVLLLIIGTTIMILGGIYIPQGPPEVAREFVAFWAPPAAQLQYETAAFRGGWLAQMPLRASHAIDFQTEYLLTWGLWRAGANMLIGMALLKWGVVTAQRSKAFYQRLAVIGFGLGLPPIMLGVVSMSNHDWETFHSFFIASQYNYWGSLLVASGWVGLVIALRQFGLLPGLAQRLIAVGRTAFTCYIGTSIVCTLFFYGHGLGYYGHVSRPGQIAVTIAVWILWLIAAPWWLERYRFGPLEWMWRSLTYGERQPLRRDRQSSREIAQPLG